MFGSAVHELLWRPGNEAIKDKGNLIQRYPDRGHTNIVDFGSLAAST